jgi:hypothetical protein
MTIWAVDDLPIASNVTFGALPFRDGDDVVPPQRLREPELVISVRVELVALRTADQKMPDNRRVALVDSGFRARRRVFSRWQSGRDLT